MTSSSKADFTGTDKAEWKKMRITKRQEASGNRGDADSLILSCACLAQVF